MLFFYLNTSIIVEKQMLPSNAKQGISEGINRYVKTLFKILAKKKTLLWVTLKRLYKKSDLQIICHFKSSSCGK